MSKGDSKEIIGLRKVDQHKPHAFLVFENLKTGETGMMARQGAFCPKNGWTLQVSARQQSRKIIGVQMRTPAAYTKSKINEKGEILIEDMKCTQCAEAGKCDHGPWTLFFHTKNRPQR